jgi:hypothetical protein
MDALSLASVSDSVGHHIVNLWLPSNCEMLLLISVSFEAEARLKQYLNMQSLPMTIRTINQLLLFGVVIDIFSDYCTKPINTFCGKNAELLIVKPGGTYSFQ